MGLGPPQLYPNGDVAQRPENRTSSNLAAASRGAVAAIGPRGPSGRSAIAGDPGGWVIIEAPYMDTGQFPQMARIAQPALWNDMCAGRVSAISANVLARPLRGATGMTPYCCCRAAAVVNGSSSAGISASWPTGAAPPRGERGERWCPMSVFGRSIASVMLAPMSVVTQHASSSEAPSDLAGNALISIKGQQDGMDGPFQARPTAQSGCDGRVLPVPGKAP